MCVGFESGLSSSGLSSFFFLGALFGADFLFGRGGGDIEDGGAGANIWTDGAGLEECWTGGAGGVSMRKAGLMRFSIV